LGSKRMILQDGWKLIHDQHGNVSELYDLRRDPGETRNRFEDEPARAAALRSALSHWFRLESPAALAATLADRTRPAGARAAAAPALGELMVPEPAPPLRAPLSDPDREVAAEAALALAELADDSARFPLLALLESSTFRLRAALGLGHLRDRRAVPALLES